MILKAQRQNERGSMSRIIWMTMKLSVVLLVAAVFNLNARGLSQKLTISVKNASLSEVFSLIKKQTGCVFLYDDNIVKNAMPVSLQLNNSSLEAALTECLRGQPLEYEIADKTIFITGKKKKDPAPDKEELQPPATLKGRITSDRGEPLSGATVQLAGTSLATSTDVNGIFVLNGVPEGTYKLTVSFVGFQSLDKEILMGANDQELNISLKPKENALEQVIIGSNVVSTKRKAEVSSVTVIDSKIIAASPYQTVDQLFRGLVPGLNSVDAGVGSNYMSRHISVRGATTTSGENMLKVYVDGVELSYGSSLLSSLDKNNIERIEIVRGAGASTLYGSGANAGVIQIFTKKGSREKPALNISLAAGPVESDYTKSNIQSQHSLNYSGGASNVSYSLGAQYRTLPEIVPDANEKYGAFSGSSKMSFGKLTLDLTLQYAKLKQGYATNPVLNKLFEEGNYPVAPNSTKDVNTTTNQLAGANLQYRLFDWWMHSLVLGISNQEIGYWTTVKEADGYYYNNTKYTTPSLRYFSTFQFPERGFLKATLITGFEYAQLQQVRISGYTTESKGQGSFTSGLRISNSNNNNLGYFAQLQPQFGEHLFLTAGVRVEKNDFFGPDYGWNGMAVAPRIGATGNFTLASFIFKPRISYGKGISAPTFTQRFGNMTTSTVTLPNDSIAPQSQAGMDYGLEVFGFNDKWRLEASYYDQKVTDLITSLSLGTDGNGMRQVKWVNLQSVRNTGYEFELSGKMGHFDVTGTYSIVNSNAEKLGDDYTGYLTKDKRILSTARYLAGFTASYGFTARSARKGFTKNGSVSLNMNYMAGLRNYDYVAYYTELFGNANYGAVEDDFIITYPSVMKFNLSANYRFSSLFSLFAQVRNLTNNYRYEILNLSPVQGRSWLIGVNLSL